MACTRGRRESCEPRCTKGTRCKKSMSKWRGRGRRGESIARKGNVVPVRAMDSSMCSLRGGCLQTHYTLHRYTHTVVPGEAEVVICTCWKRSSSSFMGLFLSQISFACLV